MRGKLPAGMVRCTTSSGIRGDTILRELIGGKPKLEEALAMVPQTCEALQYAHDQGKVLRAIKAEDILLDCQGRVRIADFGLVEIARPSPQTPLPQGEGPGEAARGNGSFYYFVMSPKGRGWQARRAG